MPLEEKVHTVPNLKALNSIFEHSIQNEHGSPFTETYNKLKSTYFASYTAQVVVYCEGSCIQYVEF